MLRRTLIKSLFVGVLPLAAGWSLCVNAAPWLKSAFDATQLEGVLEALAVKSMQSNAAMLIDAPQKAENGAVVQVALQVPAPVGALDEIALIAEANPTPLIARFHLSAQVYPKLITRVKLAQSGNVLVVAHDRGGPFIKHARQVEVLEDGCASSEREEPFASSMKLRAKPIAANATDPQLVELKIIILHPMRTGRAKDEASKKLPAHFMQQMQIKRNGVLVLEAETGTAIARNPYFTFYLTQAQLGDEISVHWQDNLGYQGEGKVQVSA